jgi:hypothetical protein
MLSLWSRVKDNLHCDLTPFWRMLCVRWCRHSAARRQPWGQLWMRRQLLSSSCRLTMQHWQVGASEECRVKAGRAGVQKPRTWMWLLAHAAACCALVVA